MRSRRFNGFTALLALVSIAIGLTPRDGQAQESPPDADADTLALVHVNVLPMDAPRVLRDQTLLIADGRIEAMGPSDSTQIPGAALVLELPGRWVVPGLVDMHVHLFSADELPLYLDAGITSVRNMWGWDLHLELRGARDAAIRPRIFTSGRLLDGDPPVLRGSAALTTPEQAREEVARQARAGFDGIKIYDRLDPSVFAAVVLAARRADLPVWGHPPESVGIDGALAAGVATLEHLRGVPRAVSAGGDGWNLSIDPAALADLALRVREAGTTIVPTLVVHEASELSAPEQRALLQDPDVARIPRTLRSFCCDDVDDAADDLAPGVRDRRHANRREVVAALHRAGVRLLVGSDTGNRWVVPGRSFHDELALLREAGLSPFESLRAASRDAALELDADSDIGGVTVGRSADLLIVPGNPLEDLDVLRRPEAVMVGGRWHRSPGSAP